MDDSLTVHARKPGLIAGLLIGAASTLLAILIDLPAAYSSAVPLGQQNVEKWVERQPWLSFIDNPWAISDGIMLVSPWLSLGCLVLPVLYLLCRGRFAAFAGALVTSVPITIGWLFYCYLWAFSQIRFPG